MLEQAVNWVLHNFSPRIFCIQRLANKALIICENNLNYGKSSIVRVKDAKVVNLNKRLKCEKKCALQIDSFAIGKFAE